MSGYTPCEIFIQPNPFGVKPINHHLLPTLQTIIDGICFGNHFRSIDSDVASQVITHQSLSSLQKPHRYYIAGPNNIQTLTVPITQSDKHNPINPVRINYNENWKKDHKNAWQTAYGKSPFFEYYDYRFWSILDADPIYLSDLILPWNRLLFDKLGLFEMPFLPPEIAKQEPLSNKINALPYTQVFDVKFGFRGEVSAIDLLFNLGPLAKEYLIQYLPTNTIFAP